MTKGTSLVSTEKFQAEYTEMLEDILSACNSELTQSLRDLKNVTNNNLSGAKKEAAIEQGKQHIQDAEAKLVRMGTVIDNARETGLIDALGESYYRKEYLLGGEFDRDLNSLKADFYKAAGIDSKLPLGDFSSTALGKTTTFSGHRLS